MSRRSIIPFILIITSIGIGLGMIKPKYDEIGALQEAEGKFDAALLKAEEIKTESANLTRKLSDVSPNQREKLLIILPAEIDELRLLNNISGIARGHGVQLAAASTDKTQREAASSKANTVSFERKEYNELEVSISLTMDYKEFLSFLKDIERSVQLLDIQSISFMSSDVDEEYTYQIKAKTYSFDQSLL